MQRIHDAFQKQSVRRRRRRHRPIVIGAEQLDEGRRRSAAGGDLHHRSDKESHHVVQESVRLDREARPAAVLRPLCVSHGAAMLVTGWRGAAHGEAVELMLAQ